MSDERQGLPSASNVHRLAACPGSFRMCVGIADRPTEDSDFGHAVHEFLAGRLKAEDLDGIQLDIAESCQEIEARLVAEWRARHGIHEDAGPEITRDSERLWIYDDDEKRCSGVADVVYRWSSLALILDYKTLPGDHADGAENLQLRTLACLVDEEHAFALSAADVAIIQPLVTHSPTVCQYDRAALSAARIELLLILQRASRTDAPLNPGPHCTYCRAAATCPAVRKEVETLSALTINASGLTVSDEDMASLRAKCGPAIKMVESIKAECFRRAQADPETWRKLGYEIKEGAGRRAVEDVATVSERLNKAGVAWPEITAACTITIGNVETLTRKATGSKGIALKRECEGILADCIEVKTAKPSLKRIGNGEDEE